MEQELTREVYWARDGADAYLARGVLADAGIDAIVVGEELQLGAGELQMGPDAAPRLRVAESQAAEARACLDEWQAARRNEPEGVWTCAACGAEVDAPFNICWSCQAPRGDAVIRPVEPDAAPVEPVPASAFGAGHALLLFGLHAGLFFGLTYVLGAVGVPAGGDAIVASALALYALVCAARWILPGGFDEAGRKLLGLRKPNALWYVLGWILISWVTVWGTSDAIFGPLLPWTYPTPEFILQTTAGRIFAMFWVCVFIPVSSELLYRGVLQSALRRRVGLALAVLVSTALYTVLHPAFAQLDESGVALLALSGLSFAMLREWSRSLYPGILAHGYMNFLWISGLFLTGFDHVR